MTEKPIIFSGESVRAILSGSKTMTRRAMRPQPNHDWLPVSYGEVHKMVDGLPDPSKVIGWGPCDDEGLEAYPCPYGPPGSRLWVRETWCQYGSSIIYRADYDKFTPISDGIGGPWKSPIYMPRSTPRITLEITGVRVERLQDITREDCQAEGHPMQPERSNDPEVHLDAARDWFMDHWDSINGKKHPWKSNCWVWVIEFRRVEP